MTSACIGSRDGSEGALPLPSLVGRGKGWGSPDVAPPCSTARPPTPTLPHTRGRGSTQRQRGVTRRCVPKLIHRLELDDLAASVVADPQRHPPGPTIHRSPPQF